MRLSVIVPVYNMASDGKLTYCLDSLIRQTLAHDDYEIIAVDDASTDDSYAILKSYEEKEPSFFRAMRLPENRHQGGAKNKGLSVAKGEWISFIDADDWVTEDFYERLFTLAEETGADVVGCDFSRVTTHTMTPGVREANHTKEQEGVLTDEKRRLLVLDAGALVCNIYRRHVVYGAEEGKEEVQVFPEQIFYEDNAVGSSFMMRAERFAYLPEPLYFYYQHEASTVHTVTMERLLDRTKAGKLLLGAAKENGALTKYRPEIEYKFTRLYYINTLFSAMQARPHLKGCYQFTKRLAGGMKKAFPLFADNAYYREEVHPEEQKLIAMQMRSQLLFYVYYRLLYFYRGIRYGK